MSASRAMPASQGRILRKGEGCAAGGIAEGVLPDGATAAGIEVAEETAGVGPEESVGVGVGPEETPAARTAPNGASPAGIPVKALGLEPDSRCLFRRLRSVRISAA